MMDRRSATRGVALVLGAAGVVGSAIVARLQSDGYATVGIDGTASEEVTPSIVADSRIPEEIAAAVDRIVAEVGPIAVLVTAVGGSDDGRMGELDERRWKDLLDSHLRAATNVCRAVLPQMLDGHGGTVVTLTTDGALLGDGPGRAYESAAAATIVAFTKSLAAEVAAAGVRINCITVPSTGGAQAVADTVAFLVRDGDFYVGQVFAPNGPLEVAP